MNFVWDTRGSNTHTEKPMVRACIVVLLAMLAACTSATHTNVPAPSPSPDTVPTVEKPLVTANGGRLLCESIDAAVHLLEDEPPYTEYTYQGKDCVPQLQAVRIEEVIAFVTNEVGDYVIAFVGVCTNFDGADCVEKKFLAMSVDDLRAYAPKLGQTKKPARYDLRGRLI